MTRTLGLLLAAALLAACTPEAPDPPLAPPDAAAVDATAAEHAHDAPTASPAAQAAPAVPVIEQELAYGEAGTRNLVGFLAMPGDAAEPLPGLIVIHEWWGLNDNIKAMTRRLAGEGYVALAVDLYGGRLAGTPEEARALMTELVAAPDAARVNLTQAYEYLTKYAFAPTVGSIGWCLGGGWSLQTALLLPEELDAMVMYYGQVVTDEERLATLRMPLLGHFAALDESVPIRDVQAFRSTLNRLGKAAQILIYPDVEHAFANPSGGAYDAAAAEKAWSETVTFLRQHLRPSGSGATAAP
jgi:carboxymethylenebutenolidase